VATVVIDASDAAQPLRRGVGRYVAELVHALAGLDGAAPALSIRAIHGGGALPEVCWEQLGFPARARRLGAGVVHAPNCFLALRRPCPGVVTVHDLAFEDHPEDFSPRTGLKYRFFAPRALRSAERVICVSRYTADDVARRYGVAPERLRVVPLAPALPLFAEGEERGVGPARGGCSPGYLLGVGDLRAKKDWATLVRAWLRVRRGGRELRLVLAGVDAGEGERLRALAGGEPLELTGYLSDVQLDQLLRGARALVHPSRFEGFGLVLLEAMSRGTPVLAAGATALPETGGDAALYFPPGDDRELAVLLERLLGDEALEAGLVARGRARAAAYSWAACAQATAAVYRELL
jgi:glycosyltransferase involved in cell wall biosynthesis